MSALIGNKWDEVLSFEYEKEYFKSLMEFLDSEYLNNTIYPPRDKVFAAFSAVDFDDVRVVILGQDPYHGEGQANGMAFAVNAGVSLPPSLKNIYKEIESDLGVKMPQSGSLTGWARQGVLLLNTVLTVQKDRACSHAGAGWKKFTDAAISSLNSSDNPIVYILWGAGAGEKKRLIHSKKHYIITSPHPSPLSAYRGFFGSKPFSGANNFLKAAGQSPIDWREAD